MTSLATILGMIPMALALEEGSELYAPLARAVIGGLTVSVVLTVFVVPAAYLIVHRNRNAPGMHLKENRHEQVHTNLCDRHCNGGSLHCYDGAASDAGHSAGCCPR